MPPPYLNVMDKLQLRSKELDNNEIEQFTEQWNNIIRHAKKDFTSIMIFAKTAEVEKLEKRYKESLETLRECIREPFDTLIHTIKTRHDQITEKKIHFLEQKTYRTRET
jgi:vacuolar-type H+-ATPase subunit H